jgi:hypothetical protein
LVSFYFPCKILAKTTKERRKMARVLFIGNAGLWKFIFHKELKNSQHQLVVRHSIEDPVNLDIMTYDLIVVEGYVDGKNDGWKLGKDIKEWKKKIIILSHNPPPPEYRNIPWIEKERLFFEIDKKEVFLPELIDRVLR